MFLRAKLTALAPQVWISCLLILLLPVALITDLAASNFHYVNLRLFSVIDELTGMLFLTMALILYFQPNRDTLVAITNPVIAALISLAILLEFKSFTEDLSNSIWLDTMGQALGAFFISLTLFKKHLFLKIRVDRLFLFPVFLSGLTATGILIFGSHLPPPHSADLFAPIIKIISFFSGIPFVVATWFLYREHQRNQITEYGLLAIFSFYFGVSGLINPLVRLWGPQWWLLQIYQLVPALFIVVYVARHYRQHQVESERKKKEIQELYEELKGTHARLETFSSIAAHDLKSPLTNISCFSQLIQKEVKTFDNTALNEYIQFVIADASRLRGLIDDLLNYSRAKQSFLEITDVSCNRLLQEVFKSQAAEINKTGAEITVAPLPTVRADKMQMTQLFQNLISNSLKYRSEKPPRISISSKKQGADWVFEVKDNGIGFPKEKKDAIFQPFQRLHSRSKVEGTGLGLTICKEVIERHKGRMWVDSTEGKGTSFFFALPAT